MAGAINALKSYSLAFLNILYPKICQGCGALLHYKNKFHVCADCIAKININKPPFCLKCGRPMNAKTGVESLCGGCIGAKHYFEKAFSCCNYEGLIKALIHKFKYNHKKQLIHIFDKILINFIKNYMDIKSIDVLVPVPLHQGKLQQRGFDQSLLLAKGVSREFKLPISYNALKRKKDTAGQVYLNKKERLNNIKGAFCLRDNKSIDNKNALLIDDVITTSATANECANILKNSGAKSVFLITLAKGA